MLAVNGANWTQPVFSVADIQREIAVLDGSGAGPGLKQMDPAAVLAAPG